MKKIILAAVLFLAVKNCDAQVDPTATTAKNIAQIPSFSIIAAPDSSIFYSTFLTKGKPLVLMFFNPDCDHCQKETKELLAYREELREIPVVMVSALPYHLINSFYSDYNIALMANVKMGQDKDYKLGLQYKPTHYPAIYIYDHTGSLVKVYSGNVGVPAILDALK